MEEDSVKITVQTGAIQSHHLFKIWPFGEGLDTTARENSEVRITEGK